MTTQQSSNVPQAHPLKFRNLVRGGGGPKEAVNDVIDDREELEDYAQDCTGDDDRQKLLDAKPRFEREKVIAVALGQRPTPAYEVEIVSVVQITGGIVGVQTQISYVTRAPRGPATPPDALVLPSHPHHVVRVKNAGGLILFRDITDLGGPTLTTLAVGKEGPTTLAVGEEDPSTKAIGEEHPTTLAVGEEAPSTKAIGEEDPTTQAVGEEGPTYTTLAVGEEGPTYTTLAVGEESQARRPTDPTTLATGEESGSEPTTLATGEESSLRATTLAVGEEDTRPTTLATGEEDTRPTTLATGEETWGGWGRGGGGPFGGY